MSKLDSQSSQYSNLVSNLTRFAYSKNSPLPNAHTYLVIDHNGECVDEFDAWEDAAKCYLDQSPAHLVGAWLIYAVCTVKIH